MEPSLEEPQVTGQRLQKPQTQVTGPLPLTDQGTVLSREEFNTLPNSPNQLLSPPELRQYEALVKKANALEKQATELRASSISTTGKRILGTDKPGAMDELVRLSTAEADLRSRASDMLGSYVQYLGRAHREGHDIPEEYRKEVGRRLPAPDGGL